MRRLKVLSIFGTRPEVIKLAPVMRALQRDHESFEASICTTAQHREMVDRLLEQFDLRADFDLDIMTANQSLGALTSSLIQKLDLLYQDFKPDWILIQGDTTSVMAASLVAYYHRIKIGHVEAGLRTYDKWAPFPEEMNRCITDLLSDLYFAPTPLNREALLKEGVADERIIVTGNTVIDSLELMRPNLVGTLPAWLKADRKLILFTAHRRENHGEPFRQICRAVRRVAQIYATKYDIIFPVHPNPNIQDTALELLSGVANIKLCDPLPYQDLLAIMAFSVLIITDSGGIQEEAPSFGVPTLVLRDQTERPEGVLAGVVRLIGSEEETIVQSVTRLLEDRQSYQTMCASHNPYGDGRAAERIVNAIKNFESTR